MAALERAADPDQDGDFNDRLDVVNLSVGTDFGESLGGQTELDMVDQLVALGTCVVASAGNSGNTFYATSSPGLAPSAISVAASIDDGTEVGALRVSSPPVIEGLYEAVEGSITRALEETGSIAGTLVRADPVNACSMLSNSAAIAGKIAFIRRGSCTFHDKIVHAQQAGARAVVVANNVNTAIFSMGGDPTDIAIPGVMISKPDGDIIESHLASGDVGVSLDDDLKKPRPGLADRVAAFSSRGPSVREGILKPDISAPGTDIVSAQAGAGTTGISQQGTSMSSPHVAGVAALLKQIRPEWTPQQLKAALINTARPMQNFEGNLYPQSRVGAGRIQPAEAALAEVTAAVEDAPGEVALSFGAMALINTTVDDRAIVLTNHGGQTRNFQITVEETIGENGVTVTPLQSSVTVPGDASASVPVSLRADPSRLDRTGDSTTSPTQREQTRHLLYEASGRIRFDDGLSPIHLPYHASLRAASNFQSFARHLVLPLASGKARLPLGQSPVEVSIPLAGSSAHPEPLVSVFELGVESPAENIPDFLEGATDLLWIGVTSNVASVTDFSDATIYFGIATAADWATLNSLEIGVLIDVDRDGADDYNLFTWNTGGAAGDASTDTFLAALRDLETSELLLDSLAGQHLSPGSTRHSSLQQQRAHPSGFCRGAGIGPHIQF